MQRVYVERESSPIKAGWSARSPQLRLAAHGRDRELADANLCRTISRFLAPFERAGTLRTEVATLRLARRGDGPGITIVLIPPPEQRRPTAAGEGEGE